MLRNHKMRRYCTAKMTVEMDNIDEKWLEKSKSLLESPLDFEKWQDLINYTESQLHGGIVKSSSHQDKYLLLKTYENLLETYPTLEKMWCSLAQWHFKLGDTETCVVIYEKALSVIPNSLVVWLSYLNFLQFYKSGTLDALLGQFERARLAVGLHYYSDKFYDLYLDVLDANDLKLRYFALLRRVLEIPIYNYSKFFSMFFRHIENMKSTTELEYICSAKELRARFAPLHPLSKEEALQDLKTKLKKSFVDLYITTQYHSYQFYQFEKDLIRHFYQPGSSLNFSPHWEPYLVFMETSLLNQSHTKDKLNYQITLEYVNNLYERCLLTQCDSEKYWSKYINFQISTQNFATAIAINKRALKFIRTSTPLILKLADLYSMQGDSAASKAHILYYYKLFPTNVELFNKLISFESQDGTKMLDLVKRKLSSVSRRDQHKFAYVLQDLQNYKTIDTQQFRDLLESLQSTFGHSHTYWKIVLCFIKLNYTDEYDEYLEKVKANYNGSDDGLTQLISVEDPHRWLDQF